MEEGRVKETGSHDELMALEGLYHSLVMRQVQEKVWDEKPLTNRIYPKLGQDSTEPEGQSLKDGQLPQPLWLIRPIHPNPPTYGNTVHCSAESMLAFSPLTRNPTTKIIQCIQTFFEHLYLKMKENMY